MKNCQRDRLRCFRHVELRSIRNRSGWLMVKILSCDVLEQKKKRVAFHLKDECKRISSNRDRWNELEFIYIANEYNERLIVAKEQSFLSLPFPTSSPNPSFLDQFHDFQKPFSLIPTQKRIFFLVSLLLCSIILQSQSHNDLSMSFGGRIDSRWKTFTRTSSDYGSYLRCIKTV